MDLPQICWSYFDPQKFQYYLQEALAVNPNHPRTHYILGLEAKKEGYYAKAISHYEQAIAHYPQSDRYHLNEAYNNLGSVYFALGNYAGAKAAWEKGLLLLPADEVVRRNLIENIYENPNVPQNLRAIAPFIHQHLHRYNISP